MPKYELIATKLQMQKRCNSSKKTIAEKLQQDDRGLLQEKVNCNKITVARKLQLQRIRDKISSVDQHF